MQAALSLDDPTWNRQPQRLAVSMVVSTLAVLLLLSTVDWPPRFSFPRLIPVKLEVTLRDAPDVPAAEVRERPQAEARERPQAEAQERQQAEPRLLPRPATVAPPTEPEERVVATEPPAVSAAVPEGVDWHVELERVAAEIVVRAAEAPQSMHPELDELRRIAALRYSKPITNKPPSNWQAEHSFMIREDPGLVDRYALGTFEQHMIQFTIPFGRPRPKNLPWVETIRARYDYLGREPDELPLLKATPGKVAE
ncbi:MAG TPA: hypothetical protein VFG91_08655 [Woeseiaceae bacterium]|nr:hypothetical protein [Woeseiaceae bacterium]